MLVFIVNTNELKHKLLKVLILIIHRTIENKMEL